MAEADPDLPPARGAVGYGPVYVELIPVEVPGISGKQSDRHTRVRRTVLPVLPEVPPRHCHGP